AGLLHGAVVLRGRFFRRPLVRSQGIHALSAQPMGAAWNPDGALHPCHWTAHAILPVAHLGYRRFRVSVVLTSARWRDSFGERAYVVCCGVARLLVIVRRSSG